ncbi:MAG: hypothetical protein K2K17_09155 [Lachnospiraceae bacterium]|nr:hypothetical protein [Lachnospiraceae bacterium]
MRDGTGHIANKRDYIVNMKNIMANKRGNKVNKRGYAANATESLVDKKDHATDQTEYMADENGYLGSPGSSRYILARKEELSEKLKNTIIDYVTDQMLGKKFLTPDHTEEQIQQIFEEEYIEGEAEQKKIRKALKEGKSVYKGRVEFEFCKGNYSALFEKLWRTLEIASGDEFEAINGYLDY